MTFCLGMNLEEGLVGIADTRVLSGSEVILARKVSVYQQEGQAMFLMTSGLRSLRDKAVTYFEDAVAQQPEPFDRLFKAVNLFTAPAQTCRQGRQRISGSERPAVRIQRAHRRSIRGGPGTQTLSRLPARQLGGSGPGHALSHHRRIRLR